MSFFEAIPEFFVVLHLADDDSPPIRPRFACVSFPTAQHYVSPLW